MGLILVEQRLAQRFTTPVDRPTGEVLKGLLERGDFYKLDLALTMNQATGFRSMPITLQPSRSASTTVVPPPMNGSSISLPFVSGSLVWSL